MFPHISDMVSHEISLVYTVEEKQKCVIKASILVPYFTISVYGSSCNYPFHSLFFSFYVHVCLGIQCCIGDEHKYCRKRRQMSENETKQEKITWTAVHISVKPGTTIDSHQKKKNNFKNFADIGSKQNKALWSENRLFRRKKKEYKYKIIFSWSEISFRIFALKQK